MSVKFHLLPLLLSLFAPAAFAADHVIVISVDGLRPDVIDEVIDDDDAPNFERLQQEGSWTHNARTDYFYTRTLQNNISIVTGRPVAGDLGHGWTQNSIASQLQSIHDNKGSYVGSMYDVAHDFGYRTALYRSKEKLVIFDLSYDTSDGATDTTGVNNGRRKIDFERSTDSDPFIIPQTAALLVDRFLDDYAIGEDPIHLSFIHLVDPDPIGHSEGWAGSDYDDSIIQVDNYLGLIIGAIENNPTYAGKTTIILTTDHGGEGIKHDKVERSKNYTIPFYVWGADVPAQADLYNLNPSSRIDPSNSRPEFAVVDQPIRNGDAANLALDLLNLPAIAGSSINVFQNLAVSASPPPPVVVKDVTITFNSNAQPVLHWEQGTPASVQISTPSLDGWYDAPGRTWPSTDGIWADTATGIERRFYRLDFE